MPIRLSDEHVAMSYLIPAYVDYLRAGGYSERTITERREVLQRLHHHLPFGLAYAATEQLAAWQAEPSWAAWTRITYNKHVRAFYKWATETGELDGDPAASLPRPKVPRLVPKPVSDAEMARALESPEPWYTVVALAGYAGLRADEIGRARREDVTEELVTVPIGKGGEPGVVPTNPFLWGVVRDRPPGPLVHDGWGRPVTGRWLSINARAHFDGMDLPGVHLHRLRHWFGTKIQEAFHDLRITQECLRHSSVTSTQGYTLVTGKQRAAAVETLPVLDKKSPASH